METLELVFYYKMQQVILRSIKWPQTSQIDDSEYNIDRDYWVVFFLLLSKSVYFIIIVMGYTKVSA